MNRSVVAIVPCMGKASQSEKCLRSLVQDSHEKKIVLVENGTLENTVTLKQAFPSVQFVPLAQNEGFAGGINKGISTAAKLWNPDFYFFLNNDAQIEPGAIKILIENMEKWPSCGMAAPKILQDRQKKIIWTAGGEFFPGRFLARNRGQGREDRGQYDRSEECSFLSGCALIVRKEVIEKIGGFDENFFTYAEDLDYCLRARKSGWKLLYVPQAVVYHEGSATSGSEYEPFQSFYRWRNRFLIVAKHGRSLQRVCLYAFFFPALIVRDMWVYLTKRRVRSIPYLWAGFFQFLRMCVFKTNIEPMRSVRNGQ